MNILLCIVIVIIILWIIFGVGNCHRSESLEPPFGLNWCGPSDVPCSAWANVQNWAPLPGGGPLGNPKTWIPAGSAITQGQYSLRQPIRPVANTGNYVPPTHISRTVPDPLVGF